MSRHFTTKIWFEHETFKPIKSRFCLMRSENVVLLPFDLVGLESRDHTSPISSSIRIQEIPMVVQTREVANNNLQTCWGGGRT